jgi:hypothetical protein
MAEIIIDGLDYGPAPEAFPDFGGWSQPTGMTYSPSILDTTPTPRTTSTSFDMSWITGSLSKLVDYGIARDAATHGLTAVRSANGTPVSYTQAGVTIPPLSGNLGGILLIGGAVLVAVMVASHKG